jgi:hypothetical protein
MGKPFGKGLAARLRLSYEFGPLMLAVIEKLDEAVGFFDIRSSERGGGDLVASAQ